MFYVRYMYGINTTYTEDMANEFMYKTGLITPDAKQTFEAHDTKESAINRAKELDGKEYYSCVFTNAGDHSE